jgi:flavin reductase (DIM6/NTAB) family NADH-FMN oxidoreductase RutF
MSQIIDPVLFRETLGHYPTGVAVVTAIAGDGKPVGMVVGSFTSVSLNPPLVAFFPASSSQSFAYLKTSRAFCVNVLASDQEPLCRQIVTGGTDKFDSVRWQPAPLGSPVLEGAVSWIECTFEEIREAGDHFIVIGLVREMAVERPTLPLLFFQGGYGRFSPGSFVAAPDPELIQAAHLAETLRGQVEALSIEYGVNCSIVAKIRSDAVHVLAANRRLGAGPLPLGHRAPLIPPLGAVFLVDSTPAEVDEWLGRSAEDVNERRELFGALLEKVRVRGYSLALVGEPAVLERRKALLSAFELSDRLPRQERVVRQVISEMVELYEPDLVPGKRYDVLSILVPVAAPPDYPPIAIRMAGLPSSASPDQIESWIQSLKLVASTAARRR